MAAVLGSGDDAVLSHGSAAALWGIGPEWHLIEISVRHRTWSRLSSVKGRARPSLPEQDVTVQHGIPVTTPLRTVLDQAATPISDASLERLVNEADVARAVDFDFRALRRYCDLRAGEPGVRRLRRLLDPETFRLSDSELERVFRPLAIAAGLPQPLTKTVSTATRSTSTGPISAWWSRPTRCAITATRSSSPATLCAIRSIPPRD